MVFARLVVESPEQLEFLLAGLTLEPGEKLVRCRDYLGPMGTIVTVPQSDDAELIAVTPARQSGTGVETFSYYKVKGLPRAKQVTVNKKVQAVQSKETTLLVLKVGKQVLPA